MGFVISPLIANDKTDNICYKYLKLEQMGEWLHAIWNLLYRTRFFCIRNGNDRLLNMFMEYENSLYIKINSKLVSLFRHPPLNRIFLNFDLTLLSILGLPWRYLLNNCIAVMWAQIWTSWEYLWASLVYFLPTLPKNRFLSDLIEERLIKLQMLNSLDLWILKSLDPQVLWYTMVQPSHFENS